MRVFGELSFKKIALLFGKTPDWACVTFYRAKKQIIEYMAKELVLPSAPNVQEESGKVLKGLKRQIKIEKMVAASIAAVITAIIVISACMVYIHVGVVQDHFSQNTTVALRDIQTDEGWQSLEIGEGTVPIILTGNNHSIENMQKLLADKTADYFALSRPLIREPDLPNKWMEGSMEPAKCVSCSLCYTTHGKRCIFNK